MDTSTKPEIVLPADVYDALELSVIAHGGKVGRGYWKDHTGAPVCLLGHAQFLDGTIDDSPYSCGGTTDEPGEVEQALAAVGFTWENNDDVLLQLPRRPRTITWARYIEAANIKRGAA